MQNSYRIVNPKLVEKTFLIKFPSALNLVAIKSLRKLDHNLHKSKHKNIKIILNECKIVISEQYLFFINVLILNFLLYSYENKKLNVISKSIVYSCHDGFGTIGNI